MGGHLGDGEAVGRAAGDEFRDPRDVGERLERRPVVRAVDDFEEDLEEKGPEDDRPVGSLGIRLVGAEEVPEELPHRGADGEDVGVDRAEPREQKQSSMLPSCVCSGRASQFVR